MDEQMRYAEDPPHTEGDGYRALVRAIDKLRDEIGTRHVENTSSAEVLRREVKLLIDRVDDIAKGFPDNDPEGHRRAHEALIKRAEERAALYRALREELVKRGVLAFIVMLGTLLCLGIAAKFHVGVK